MSLTIKIDTREWAKKVKNYSLKVQTKLDNEVKATALAIDRGAKKTVRVDTGRLRASIHPQFKGTNAYSYSGKFGNFDGFFKVILKVFEAAVGTNVHYAKKIERRFPFLEPAVNSEKSNFENRLKKIFKV